MIYEVLDGSKDAYTNPGVWGDSAIAAIVAILMVFVILIIIIGITYLIFKLLGYFELKKQLDGFKENGSKSEEITAKPAEFDTNNEDMVAAVMVATIDYQNEIKQDVKLVSVKEIKQ